MKSFLVDVFVKNSKKSFLDPISSTLSKPICESNQTSDIESYSTLIKNAISRVSMTSILDKISSVVPSPTPQGTIPVITAKYTGQRINGANVNDNLTVLVVGDVTNVDVNDFITNNTGSFATVLYKEDKQLLVKMEVGDFQVGDTIQKIVDIVGESVGVGDDVTVTYTLQNIPLLSGSETIYLDGIVTTAYTIDYVTGTITFDVAPALDTVITANYKYLVDITLVESIRSNVVGVGGIFKDYTGPYSTEISETKENTTSNLIDIQIKKVQINVKTRKVFSGLTQEMIDDLYAMYGIRGIEKIEQIIANAIEQTIEQETFDFMRSIAYQQPNVVIKDPTTNNISISQAYEDIISRIYFSIGRIGTATNIAGKFFVIGSSNVIAAISTTGRVTNDDDTTNSKYVGELDKTITLIEDPYSFDDYIIVGLAGPDGFDNAGVIVSPYNVDFIETTNSNTFQKEIAILNRYDIIRSPLDTKTEAGKSDFFEYSIIDFSAVAK